MAEKSDHSKYCLVVKRGKNSATWYYNESPQKKAWKMYLLGKWIIYTQWIWKYVLGAGKKVEAKY